jgi:hypothetical protein
VPRLLSKSQWATLRALIRLRHDALLVQWLGDNAVNPVTLRQIKRAGLYRSAKRDILRQSYAYGRFGVTDPKVESMDAKAFAKYLAKRALPMDAGARKVIQRAKRQIQNDFVLMQRDMVSQIQKAMREAEALMAGARSLLARTEVRKKASQLFAVAMQEVTQRQLHAAQRSVETTLNNAIQYGRAQAISERGGHDPWVFKRPRPDCCNECRQAYLHPDGKTPRLFRLSELMKNGSNVGRTRDERLPTVDSLHPWCRCLLSELPDGFGFDAQGAMVYQGTAKKRTAYG